MTPEELEEALSSMVAEGHLLEYAFCCPFCQAEIPDCQCGAKVTHEGIGWPRVTKEVYRDNETAWVIATAPAQGVARLFRLDLQRGWQFEVSTGPIEDLDRLMARMSELQNGPKGYFECAICQERYLTFGKLPDRFRCNCCNAEVNCTEGVPYLFKTPQYDFNGSALIVPLVLTVRPGLEGTIAKFVLHGDREPVATFKHAQGMGLDLWQEAYQLMSDAGSDDFATYLDKAQQLKAFL